MDITEDDMTHFISNWEFLLDQFIQDRTFLFASKMFRVLESALRKKKILLNFYIFFFSLEVLN